MRRLRHLSRPVASPGTAYRSAGTRNSKGAAPRAVSHVAGITDFHPHDCRHTWATWHYAASRELGVLQRLGGWSSVRMVMRYAHANVDEHKNTIDRLPGGQLGDNEAGGQKTG
jgi:integrase